MANKHDPKNAKPCLRCGKPTWSQVGFCSRTWACEKNGRKALRAAGLRRAMGVARPCLVCGEPTRGAYQICIRTKECTSRRNSVSRKSYARSRGQRPKDQVCGANHPQWLGGQFFACKHCGAATSWKYPSIVKRNKNGMFCTAKCFAQWRAKQPKNTFLTETHDGRK